MKKQAMNEIWMYIPILGIALFLVLYVVAANYYPGGSDTNRIREGFDWVNNYWCDLLAPTTKNGKQNHAQFFALTGMIILFSSLAVFWYYLPQFFHERRSFRIIIRCTGSIGMFVLIFIFTRFHDGVIGIGSTISAVPLAATLTELKKNNLQGLYFLGWLNVLLILLNFFIYVTNWWIIALPLIQKFTLLTFLLWVLLTNIKCLKINREINLSNN